MAASRLYGVIWRWHFFVGLVACPIVLVVALTGALYTFQPELDAALAPELLVVEPGPQRVPVDALVAAAAEHCTPTGFGLASAADAAATVYCADDRGEVLLDPYTGRVLGTRAPGSGVFGVILELHWELMLGEPGRIAVEWATSWTLLLLVSGAMLWWPRGRRRGGGVWWPRFRLGGRQLIRDLHAVAGAYTLPVLFVLAATGLTWTVLAGAGRWRALVDDAAAPAPVASTAEARTLGYDAALAAAGIRPGLTPLAIYGATPVESVYELLIHDDRHVEPWRAETIWIDARTGAELRRRGWADKTVRAKLDASIYPVHVGSILGLPGRILACLAALLLAALCVTGPWMWWKRRPTGELAAPPPPARTPRALLVVLAGLGWLLPAVGLSLIAVLVIELGRWLWRSRTTATPM
jgi:uncharacterized iron-regulated membrane protein